MENKTWTNGELNDVLSDYFEIRNGKILISLPGLNRLLMDPRCPDPRQSNLAEYFQKVKKQLESRK